MHTSASACNTRVTFLKCSLSCVSACHRYTVDVNFDKKQVNKESFKDAAVRRRARGQVKQVLEERYMQPE